MSVQRIDLNNCAVSMDASTVDRLIRLGSGDASLLYLYLLRHQGEYDPAKAGHSLGWTRAQLDTALAQLQELGLASGALPPRPDDTPPQPDQAPEYSASDIAAELKDPNSEFSFLLQEIERMFGKRLTNGQVSILLELFDHVGLPAEVLFLMINWLCERNKRKYGTARNPSMSVVKRTGYRWKEQGYDTLEAAEAYIKTVSLQESREGSVMAALGIYGRQPVTSERQFIRQWLEWGFSPETVAIAYDITLTSIGKLNWHYCNGILKRWHEKNLHTPEQVQRERKAEVASNATRPAHHKPGSATANGRDPEQMTQELQQDFQDMQRLLARMKKEDS